MSTTRNTPANLRLLDDVVCALIRRHDIQPEEVKGNGNEVSEAWTIAFEKATRLKPEALGRIVFAVPDADLYGVHCGTWLGKYESGPYLLQQMAATAMVCRMRYHLGAGRDVRTYAPYEVRPVVFTGT